MTDAALNTSSFSDGIADSIEEELWFGDPDPARTEDEASRSLAAAVGQAAGLKPFPPLAAQLITLLNRPDYETSEVRKLIESDPGMVTRVLGVANSAAFMTRASCDSVEQALVRLGARTLRDIVAGVAAVSMFQDDSVNDPARLRPRIRAHCTGVAAVARALADIWRFRKAEQVFLAGLMHDLGKMLSLQCGEIAYHEMPPAAHQAVDRVHLLEREMVGYDHGVLGAHVLGLWNFPESVKKVVAWHHQPGRAYEEGGEVGLMVALVRVADGIELRLNESSEFDESWGESLTLDGTLAYADFSVRDLQEHWPRLQSAREEVIRVMGA